MSYKKSNWVPYDPTLSFEQNVTQGGTTTADKLNNMETGISNNDINKVTDNKNGTEQLNGVQVQPYNKLSDTIGGRNVLLGTQVDNVISSDTNNKWNYDILHPTTLVPGKVYTISAEVTLTGSSDSLASIHVNGPDQNTVIVGTDSFPPDGNRHSWSFTCPTSTTIFGIMIYAGVTGHTAGIGATWHHIKIEQGSIATDWTPAPEDKVNVSDMRKPASDVAGIEEVNAKQDKIGYTPADDSKVVHDNHDGTISANGASILPANEDVIGRIDGTYTDMNDIPMGWLYLNGWTTSSLSNWGLPQGFYYVHCFKTELFASTTIQMVYGVQQNNTYVRTMAGTKWTTWKLLADDSKVAHLSGANNFDTVPTVNSKPVATTDDVSNASNTVLTSANTSISKLLQSSSNNDEDSAVTNSTSDTSNFYYWTE